MIVKNKNRSTADVVSYFLLKHLLWVLGYQNLCIQQKEKDNSYPCKFKSHSHATIMGGLLEPSSEFKSFHFHIWEND